MCKFESDNAPGFSLVAEGIQRYADEAPAVIIGRWEAEKRERGLRREAEVTEMKSLYPGRWGFVVDWKGLTDDH